MTEFWRGRRVFLTGHTGFKGGWLSLWLQHLGAEVTGYALAPSTPTNLFKSADVGSGMTSVIGDIRDAAALDRAVQQARPEVVFHMAAQPLVRYSYQHPIETYATNVMGTVHLLEAIRNTDSVCAAVVVTSDKCYENREWDWGYRENDPMGGHDPYSNSKGCAELVAEAYRSSYFAPSGRISLGTARAGNVIGGGDWAVDRLVPDMVRAFESSQPVVIRNPVAIRPWQHVLEPLAGYLALAQALMGGGPAYAEGWNFGPADSDARPVEWIVETLVRRWGNGASWRLDDAAHPHEARSLKLDCSKARARLSWTPRLNLDQALEFTVDWYLAHRAGRAMRDVTLDQIKAYSP